MHPPRSRSHTELMRRCLTAAELLRWRTGQLHQSRHTFRNSDVKLDRSIVVLATRRPKSCRAWFQERSVPSGCRRPVEGAISTLE